MITQLDFMKTGMTERSDLADLRLGDCLDVMRDIPSGSIDLIVTSPPYNAGKEYEKASSLSEYRDFARKWTREIPRLLSEQGSFWLNVGYTKTGENTTLPLTYLYYPLIDLPFVQEIVWHYEGGMAYKKRFAHRTERWMWFSKNPNGMTFNLDDVRDMSLNRTVDKRNHPLGKNPTDYWYFDRVVSGTGKVKEKTDHPCQFPKKMIDRIVRACSRKGDTVLDPFMGSGTTGEVSVDNGRMFVGIENDPKYFEIAKHRVLF